MSINITLYRNQGGAKHKVFKSPSDPVEKTGALKSRKEDSDSSFSITNPVLLISMSDTSMIEYEYMKWQNRYYFIDDIKAYNGALKEVYFSLDVLMTYRNQIANCNMIVGYESDYYEPYVPDPRVVVSNDITETILTANIADNPQFLLGVNGLATASGIPGVTYHIVSNTELLDVIDNLYTTDLWEVAMDSIFNKRTEGLLSLHLFPCGLGVDVLVAPRTITIGNVVCGSSSGVLNPYANQEFIVPSIYIPKFYGNFVDHDPYTSVTINIASVGSVDLDPKVVVGHSIYVKFSGRFYLGDGIASIFRSDGYLISTHPCQIATAFPLNIESDTGTLLGVASSLATAVGSAAGGLIAGPVGAFVGGQIGSSVSHIPSYKNTAGGSANAFTSWANTVTVTVKRPSKIISSNFNAIGNVSGRQGPISDFSGSIYPTVVDGTPLSNPYSDQILSILHNGFIV